MLELKEYIKKVRRDLHKIPEIGFDLFKTHEYIVNEIKKLGYEYEVVAKTGIVVHIPGEINEAIAFRADMDGLRIKESNEIDFKSLHDDAMHACGHDGHMAMLLGFAKYLQGKKLKRSIILIFQPAEGGPGGAVEIIKEGIFNKYNINAIFGIHLDPTIEEGKFGLKAGVMFSRNGEFSITINGKSAHGAMPHLGSDAIVAAANLILAYQSIISRSINPLTQNVITIGKINGGDAINIIPKQVNLSGTIRAFVDESYYLIKQRMLEINQGIEKSFNVKIVTTINDLYLTVENDIDLYKQTINALDKNAYVIIEPLMASEDFSFYQREAKGLFVMLGVRNEKLGYIHSLHSDKFNFNEDVLLQGVNFYILQAHLHHCI